MDQQIEKQIRQNFEHLHENGEVSWEEYKTTKYIEEILESYGCETETFQECPGVVGKYGNFDGTVPVVALRADIDALWQEVNGTPCANHSCGHDSHMAMVLGVLYVLHSLKDIKNQVAVKFIFQPAEEKAAGALKMVELGVIEEVDYLFGVHLRPGAEVADGFATPMIGHGATKLMEIEIDGEDAHGARPHLTHNAVNVGTQLVQAINQIRMNPSVPHSVKVTKFHAGGPNTNIIPGKASLSLDLRAQTNEVMEELEEQVDHIFKTIEFQYGTKITVGAINQIAAARTNDEAITVMKGAIESELGEAYTLEPTVTPGGDDFHFYTIKKPELKATMLGLGCDLKPGLHHPQMTFNQDRMLDGTKILTQAVLGVYDIRAELSKLTN
ncbi:MULTISPECIES: M20 peptidase aminoacylase family protein [Pontibacillus]|uniref:M20 peptidase aminoacylase family protein n=1 Tax=Pontibacillus chungwhensis TaxID=265426 RepID=A0ABY8UU59_9BACI|nr:MULTISPECIES: M20 peptidase aminoacylase family protein [Pontibacillus]MCD5323352.1 M20 peptidase aminoacylase family protein [Pontibacillus sp. HN14]WIF96733.1 M20 peptidase aminoacylase family protein [Pontibacillus chungwhensis]